MLLYEQDNDQAGATLRMVVHLLGQMRVPANPLNYTLFYEYFLGRDEALQAAIQQCVDAKKFTNQDSIDLYQEFIQLGSAKQLADVHREFRYLLEQILLTFAHSDQGFSTVVERLDHTLGDLEKDLDADQLRQVTRAIIEEVKDFRTQSLSLQGNLQQTREEVDRLHAQLSEARQAAYTDPLTGLGNRKAFDEAAHKLVGEDEATPLTLLLIDIDHFKRFNDTYGHLVGDKVLRFVAQTLKRLLKGGDTVARFGGEEFAVLLPGTSLSDAVGIAHTIRRNIESAQLRRNDTGDMLNRLTISLGLAVARERESLNDLIDRADQALYLAKKSGRNRVITENELTCPSGL